MLEQQFFNELEKELDSLINTSQTEDGRHDLSDVIPYTFTDEIITIVKKLINKYADKYRS